MQSKSKLNAPKSAKVINLKHPLDNTFADITESVVAPAEQPVVLAENSVGVSASDASRSGQSLSAPIPAGSEIGLNYAPVIETPPTFADTTPPAPTASSGGLPWGWIGGGLGLAAVAAAAGGGGSKGGSTPNPNQTSTPVAITGTASELAPGGTKYASIVNGANVTVTTPATIAQLAAIDAANGVGQLIYTAITDTQANINANSGGYVIAGITLQVINPVTPAAAVIGTAAELVFGGAKFASIVAGANVTVTSPATVAQLAAIDAANGNGQLNLTGVTDTTANLAPNGVPNKYITAGVSVQVTDAVSIAQLAAIDAANGNGQLLYSSIADTQANINANAGGYVKGGVSTQIIGVTPTPTVVTGTAAELAFGGAKYASIKSGADVTVTDAATISQLTAIDNANGNGALNYTTIADTSANINGSQYATGTTTVQASVSGSVNVGNNSASSTYTGGNAADIFVLNSAKFDKIDGGAGAALDVLQLSANYKNIDLSQFNHAGKPSITGIEVIDMAKDIGSNALSLSAADLFLMHSNQTDVATGNTMLTINGNGGAQSPVADTINLSGFVLSGAAGSFDATGAIKGGASGSKGEYSKYISTTTYGNNQLLEVLVQNGVTVA